MSTFTTVRGVNSLLLFLVHNGNEIIHCTSVIHISLQELNKCTVNANIHYPKSHFKFEFQHGSWPGCPDSMKSPAELNWAYSHDTVYKFSLFLTHVVLHYEGNSYFVWR